MPVGIYFRQAAVVLREAIGEQKRAIDDKKRQIALTEQEMRQRKDELNRDKLQKQVRAGNVDMENGQRAVLMKEAQDDVAQIAKLERDFMLEKERIQNEISGIERDIIGLEEQAKYLESRTNE